MRVTTQGEIERIARGAQLLRMIMQNVLQRVTVGATGQSLNRYAEELMSKIGGTPAFKGYGNPPYPAAVCVSINECIVHGVPSEYRFKPGDIVKLDIGLVYDGLYSDIARMVALEPITEKEQKLMACAREALEIAIRMVKPGVTTGDIGYRVQRFVEDQGFSVIRDLAGHGIGHTLHELPELPNFGSPGTGAVLEPGMVLAFEPMIAMGSWKVTVGPDGWSVVTTDGSKTAHCEDMVAVTDIGFRVLTR